MKTTFELLDKKNAKGKARFLARSMEGLVDALNKRFGEDDKKSAAVEDKLGNIVVVLDAWVVYLSLPWWKQIFTRKPR